MRNIELLVVFLPLAMIAFGFAMVMKKMSFMDLLWTLGLALGTSLTFVLEWDETSLNLRSWITLLLILAWSIRLGYHLFRSRILSSSEDSRYISLIKYSGRAWKFVFFILFIVQVLLIITFLIPIKIALLFNEQSLSIFDLLGFFIGLCALFGEGISDAQLRNFRAKRENKGLVFKKGMWRYSRHPNYFFEWLFWWSFVFLSVGSSSFTITLSGPLLMYIFLRYISGVPFSEISSLESKGEAYKKYQSETSIFFPKYPNL